MTLYTAEQIATLTGWHIRKVQRVAETVGHDHKIGGTLVFTPGELQRLRRWKPKTRGRKPKPATV